MNSLAQTFGLTPSYGLMLKQSNIEKVESLIAQGLSTVEAIKTAYPDWSDQQVKDLAAKLGNQPKTSSLAIVKASPHYDSSDPWTAGVSSQLLALGLVPYEDPYLTKESGPWSAAKALWQTGKGLTGAGSTIARSRGAIRAGYNRHYANFQLDDARKALGKARKRDQGVHYYDSSGTIESPRVAKAHKLVAKRKAQAAGPQASWKNLERQYGYRQFDAQEEIFRKNKQALRNKATPPPADTPAASTGASEQAAQTSPNWWQQLWNGSGRRGGMVKKPDTPTTRTADATRRVEPTPAADPNPPPTGAPTADERLVQVRQPPPPPRPDTMPVGREGLAGWDDIKKGVGDLYRKGQPKGTLKQNELTSLNKGFDALEAAGQPASIALRDGGTIQRLANSTGQNFIRIQSTQKNLQFIYGPDRQLIRSRTTAFTPTPAGSGSRTPRGGAFDPDVPAPTGGAGRPAPVDDVGGAAAPVTREAAGEGAEAGARAGAEDAAEALAIGGGARGGAAARQGAPPLTTEQLAAYGAQLDASGLSRNIPVAQRENIYDFGTHAAEKGQQVKGLTTQDLTHQSNLKALLANHERTLLAQNASPHDIIAGLQSQKQLLINKWGNVSSWFGVGTNPTSGMGDFGRLFRMPQLKSWRLQRARNRQMFGVNRIDASNNPYVTAQTARDAAANATGGAATGGKKFEKALEYMAENPVPAVGLAASGAYLGGQVFGEGGVTAGTSQ